MDEPVIELDVEQAALRRRDADWVHQCLAGDTQAFGHLYDAWFDRVFDLVDRVVRDREVAAEVAQEAFFAAWRNLATLERAESFGGWLLRIARNGAYNRTQRERRSYAVDDQGLAVIESVGASPTSAPSGFGVEERLGRSSTPEDAVEDAEVVALVWEAAEALPERDLEVLDLQLRHGLSPAEVGEVLGMNRNAANQLVHRLKRRLETAIRVRVLWRDGSPACEVLAQRLADLGIDRFSADAVRVAERHVPGCVECDERQRFGLEPVALFAAVPLVAVPIALKQTAASALAASGVPMGGSSFLTTATSSIGSATGGAVHPGGSTSGGAVGGAIARSRAAPAPGSRRRTGTASRAALVVGAAATVLVALLAAGWWWGGRGDDPDLIASGAPAPAVGSLATSSTTTAPAAADPDPSTTGADPEEVVSGPGAPAPTPPTTRGAPPPSTDPTTPVPTTTRPPTTTVFASEVELTITNAVQTTEGWMMSGSRVRTAQPPVLSWSVTPSAGYTVEVTGPDTIAPPFPERTATGSRTLCPGVVQNLGSAPRCSVAAGTYAYTITVKDGSGTVVHTDVRELTVDAAPIR